MLVFLWYILFENRPSLEGSNKLSFTISDTFRSIHNLSKFLSVLSGSFLLSINCKQLKICR
jgi:hypothetical protein